MVNKILNKFCPPKANDEPLERFIRPSYAQCGEDLIVKFIFDKILQLKYPSYLDIGANHPFELSNTCLLSATGSTGVNVDPNPTCIELFSRFRPLDVNLETGVSDKPGILKFYRNVNSTLSTFDEGEAKINGGTIDVVPIDVITIQEVVLKYCKGVFPDFLSLDVEGFDQQILESMNFNASVPKVICVETIQNLGNHNWSKNFAIIDLLKDRGYHHHSDTSINSIFVLKSAMKERFV